MVFCNATHMKKDGAQIGKQQNPFKSMCLSCFIFTTYEDIYMLMKFRTYLPHI